VWRDTSVLLVRSIVFDSPPGRLSDENRPVLLHGETVRAGFAADGHHEPSSSSCRRERQQGKIRLKGCVPRTSGLREKVANASPVLRPCRALWLPPREPLPLRLCRPLKCLAGLDLAGELLHEFVPAGADWPQLRTRTPRPNRSHLIIRL
jgi:hypothetical protein